MTVSYTLTTDGGVIRTDGDVVSFIPNDSGNADFLAFSEWVAAGNTPAPPTTLPPPTMIPAGAFVNRFTQEEQVAVQTACLASAQLSWGLTLGLALGTIDLQGTTLATWMAALVTAGAITQARSTVIMTP